MFVTVFLTAQNNEGKQYSNYSDLFSAVCFEVRIFYWCSYFSITEFVALMWNIACILLK